MSIEVSSRLWHLMRLRRTEDLAFLQPGLFDELIVNANQLENSPDSTSAHLRRTRSPYMVDPVLWRFQQPAWWRNSEGNTKRNYRRLAHAYSDGTSIRMAEGPLLNTVASDHEWERLASNVVIYQRDRLEAPPTQLDLLDPDFNAELRPARVIAPALVAFSAVEDRINRLLVEASVKAATAPVVAVVAIPDTRLIPGFDLAAFLRSIPREGLQAYFLWTPGVTEELLLADDGVLGTLLAIISDLRGRGIPLVHLQGSYVTAALHAVGVSGIAHHLGWVDKGEPVAEQGGGPRSCQTYIPGLRHCARFNHAHELGRGLADHDYVDRFCDCTFCVGILGQGQHPLDLLLEDQEVIGMGRRRMPTSRAAAANTWHYLLSRRQEVDAFSRESALDVIARDIARAASLAGQNDAARLERLAAQLRAA
jgi:hypothetical protein